MEQTKTSPSAEFDHFANDYDQLLKNSIGASGYEAVFFDEHKIKTLFADYTANTTDKSKKVEIMNFGCGIGKSEPFINQYFKNCSICAVDVSEKSIDLAKEKNKQFNNIQFAKFDKVEELTSLNRKFDIIFVANVFHHIPVDLHQTTLKHLKSFLAPGGHLYVFEHNPRNPLTRKAFDTCEFDVGCNMIKPALFIDMCKNAGYSSIERRYVLFFPKMLSFLTPFEKYLNWCSLGAQYYIKAR